jgi:hypothetical protein
MKLLRLVLVCLPVLPAAGQTITPSVLFDPVFRPQPAQIAESTQLSTLRAPTVLARLPNRKLALMVREQSGRWQPLYVRGLETGYWDTRRGPGVDYDSIFANHRKLGANTSFFMIHWADVEPAEGKFDFSYTDKIVELARKNGVKLWWVLFLHCQSDHPRELREFWGHKLDSREGKDYAVQWLRDENGVVYDSMAKLATLPGRWEITPAYGHPQVMPRILRMLTRLGERYRNSDVVIGVQIDNEAGFGYYSPRGTAPQPKKIESDFNPVTAQIFEEWKLKTGKSDWHAFKLAIVKYWWKQFTTAFHKGDPYKLTSFNFLGANAEAGDPYWIDLEGVDSTTYGEGNIDVVSSMFYGATKGLRVWPNLDQHYNFAYELPIFISSEIGFGRNFNPAVVFQQYVINSIERGAQGYATYDYGSLMAADGNPNPQGEIYQRLAAMVEANEDIIHGGVPGPGPVSITTAAAGARISQLGVERTGTLGILHFPEAPLKQNPDANQAKADVSVEIKALAAGSYTVETFRSGKAVRSVPVKLGAGESHRLVISGAGETEAVFIKVKRQGA